MEALSRGPAYSQYETAPALFALASEQDSLVQLEWHCLQLAISRFLQRKLEGKLFVNISPQALSDGGAERLLTLCQNEQFHPSELVVELTEQRFTLKTDQLILICKQLREVGFLLALDDLGSTDSGLRRWLELRPDFIKLDRFFVHGLHADVGKRLVTGSLLDLTSQLGCHLIIEGVEELSDWRALEQLGIRYAQGYLLGHPQSQPRLDWQPRAPKRQSSREQKQTVRELLQQVPTMEPDQLCSEALAQFNANPGLHYIPIVSPLGRTVGLLRHATLLAHFAERFGHSLYARTPIRKLMDPNPIQVEANLDLLQVSQHLIEHNDDEMDAWFIICEEGRYLGIGQLRQLMRKLTEYKLQMARHANPLTLLPGNVPIQRMLKQAIAKQHPFYLAYCDLNHFKPFNDICGYDRGDLMIKLVARLLRHYLGQKGNFIGHLGGDDFILLLHTQDWRTQLELLQRDFQEQRNDFYRQEDRDRNYIIGHDRDGAIRHFPLTELAVGVIFWHPSLGLDANELNERLTRAKKQAKAHPGHLYWLDDCLLAAG